MRHKTSDQHHVPKDAVFDEPWRAVTDPVEADCLGQELLREAPYLADALPLAVARRVDDDDVLYNFLEANAVSQGGFPLGVVHLTWSGKEEPLISQQIGFFECWNHWKFEWDK